MFQGISSLREALRPLCTCFIEIRCQIKVCLADLCESSLEAGGLLVQKCNIKPNQAHNILNILQRPTSTVQKRLGLLPQFWIYIAFDPDGPACSNDAATLRYFAAMILHEVANLFRRCACTVNVHQNGFIRPVEIVPLLPVTAV